MSHAAGQSIVDTASASRREAASLYSWYVLGVLFLVYVVNFLDRNIISILAQDIKADLGLGDDQLGFLYGTAFAVFYALFGIPLGRLADSRVCAARRGRSLSWPFRFSDSDSDRIAPARWRP